MFSDNVTNESRFQHFYDTDLVNNIRSKHKEIGFFLSNYYYQILMLTFKYYSSLL